MPKVKIDGFETEVPDGTTILNAARHVLLPRSATRRLGP